MLVDVPFAAEPLPGYTRSRVLLRDLSPEQVDALRRIRAAAIDDDATLANGRPVTTDADALQLVLELAAAAAEE